ncbi:MAG: outer membrane lipid asymmetry maintenance protein MlaD [SAR116 cluster bacterium]|jgi:phospholipid/cholesterol/gamma-HCH transport system substrate-binding protein|nr:outer membrane lipid asymmetry maintenance protein MlaD [SAR116 cluster bacterium]MEC7171846.1 outer membrane lipid asymmetry maintenance protein MlaD [Pseudomonadota bacterium]GIS11774.1 MAG: outer membrane lipid asymmetry maintenance protein MlaD [Alphaproteobacteria bacterium]MEC7585246.1 outer membrane lipid asymmetry maintenance protein MlaD [Pseudomonadota bacterium]MEC7645019.1 outer membrane lipid asymmetry maintenance protein MlaD [Pseudomonadota bacterium]|tara:strand:- start:693 stop:1145 length:453 start_codon:yes stop_codon:yes gene_type:complete
MQRNMLETVMGAIVLLTAVAFVSLAYEAANIRGTDGYELEAEFGATGGLSVGDDVRISGIKVGRISRQELDPVTYAARIVMSLDERIRIPADSSARITAASLLGGNYLELIPGADEDMMQPGEVIYDTRDPVSLTDLLGKAVFSAANDPS